MRRALCLAAMVSGLAVLAGAAAPTTAQGLSGLQSGDEPLEINATQGIEWKRDSQVYVARGDARAAKGDLTVFADQLTAHYRTRTDGQGGSEVWKIVAEGNMRLASPTETVYGDKGVYEVDQGVVRVTGGDLRLETRQDLVTARDSLEYWERDRFAVARGAAVAQRGDKRLAADVLVASFVPNETGDLEITRIDGEGNVRVSTETEFGRGDRGIYYVKQDLATLIGSVRLTRGENQLNGEYAEVNLATGVSRLLAAPPGEAASGRVRGLLKPGGSTQ